MDFSVIEYICIKEDEEISKANVSARYGNDTKLTKYFKRINNNNCFPLASHHSTRGNNDNRIQRYDVHVEHERRTSLDAAGNLKYNCFTFTSTFRSSVVRLNASRVVLGPYCMCAPVVCHHTSSTLNLMFKHLNRNSNTNSELSTWLRYYTVLDTRQKV